MHKYKINYVFTRSAHKNAPKEHAEVIIEAVTAQFYYTIIHIEVYHG